MDKLSSVEVRTVNLVMLGMLQDDMFKMFDILKSESLNTEEYYVILFLLSLYNDDLLSKELIVDEARFVEKLKAIPSNSIDANFKGYLTVYEMFFPVLKRLSSKGIDSLIKLMSNIDQKYLSDNFSMIFDTVLYRIIEVQDRNKNEFIQPIELTLLIYELVELKQSSKIYNPFAGLVSFGVNLEPGLEYFGQEINPKTWSIGALRLMAYKRPGSSRYMFEDSLLNWPGQSEKFDFILANPPFNGRLSQEYLQIEPEIQSIEQFLIEKGLESLNNEGKLIILLPQGFFFGSRFENLRERLVKMDVVESVISLPSKIFINTAVSTSLVVLNKNKTAKGKIVFINAQDCFISNKKRAHTIDLDRVINLVHSNKISSQRNVSDFVDIERNKFILTANRYVFDELETALDEEYDLIELKQLIQPRLKGRLKASSYGKYIRIRDLSDDIKNLQKTFDNKEVDEVPKLAFALANNSLLLATRWKKLKPTFYLSGKDSVFYSQDIQSFIVNEEKVYLEYLLQELTEDYVQAQVDRLSTGAIVSSISSKDILDIKIKYPSIEKQKQIALKRFALVTTAENSLLIEKQLELIKGIADENVYLRHHVAGPFGQIQKSFESITKIIEEQVANELDDVMGLKSNPNSKLTFKRHLEIISRDIESISRSLNKTSKESDLADFKPSETDFVKFFSDYFTELKDKKGKDYSVVLLSESWILEDLAEYKVKRVLVDADETFLRKMFDNLIENAEVHGFNKSVYDAHKLEFEVMFSFESHEMQINVSNTGKPLPDNFSIDTYKRKGGTAGETGGDGYGGWLVNETMKKLDGEIHSVSDEFYKEYGAHIINKFIVELLFPIKLEFYE